MNPNKMLIEFRAFFQENSNPDITAKYARYFKEGYDSYGISSELFTSKNKEWYEKYKAEINIENVFDLANLLFESNKYEEASLAIVFVSKLKKYYKPDVLDNIGFWLEKYVSNWAHTDFICSEIISVFYKKDIVKADYIAKWRFSESKWKRRAVPVSMLTLLKLTDDFKPLLEFIRPMMLDKERVVHQGLGWFLREAWKKQPELIEQFLLEYKNTAARLIFQYATEKMPKEYRLKFKKEKIK